MHCKSTLCIEKLKLQIVTYSAIICNTISYNLLTGLFTIACVYLQGLHTDNFRCIQFNSQEFFIMIKRKYHSYSVCIMEKGIFNYFQAK